MFIVFFGNLIISRIQNSFERKYNLSTDCTNIASENIDNEIYNEFIDKNKTEKEKILHIVIVNQILMEIKYFMII